MKFMDKISDMVVSEVAGKKVETTYVSLEDFITQLEQAFLSDANTQEDFDAILRCVQGKKRKGSLLVDGDVDSKDKRYSMHCTKANIVDLRKYEIWIYDNEVGKFYTFKGGFGKEPVLAMEAKIEEYRKKLL